MNEENRALDMSRQTIPPPQGVEQARLQRSRAGQKGGERSARLQQRDSFGQFAGRSTRTSMETKPTVPQHNEGPH
ncbi:MAG TPA: hypothetical protein VD997_17375 [Phycisphaerales bacterium]|nr:hypothetical protein [Phycisphaerales bacterium]